MNKKGFKVVQISGMRGIFLIGFSIFGLFCGFVVFPIWLITEFWNSVLTELVKAPHLNAFQGSLIWGIICVLACMSCRNCFSVKVCTDETSEKELDIKKIVQEYETEKEELHK